MSSSASAPMSARPSWWTCRSRARPWPSDPCGRAGHAWAPGPIHGVAVLPAWGNPRFHPAPAALPSASPALMTQRRGEPAMDQICLVVPVLPGRTADAKDFMRELEAGRNADYQRSEQRIGIVKEAWYLARTPAGDQLVAYLESPDFPAAPPGREPAGRGERDGELGQFRGCLGGAARGRRLRSLAQRGGHMLIRAVAGQGKMAGPLLHIRGDLAQPPVHLPAPPGRGARVDRRGEQRVGEPD